MKSKGGGSNPATPTIFSLFIHQNYIRSSFYLVDFQQFVCVFISNFQFRYIRYIYSLYNQYIFFLSSLYIFFILFNINRLTLQPSFVDMNNSKKIGHLIGPSLDTFSIIFLLKMMKKNNKNLIPIYSRVTINGQRIELSTKRWISLSDWDKKNKDLSLLIIS